MTDSSNYFLNLLHTGTPLFTFVTCLATAGAFIITLYIYLKSQKEKIINAASFVLLDLLQLEKQKEHLISIINKNECDFHFCRMIMAGCIANTWPQYKSILLNKGLDRHQVEVLDSYCAIVCEIDDHLKRCRADFYKISRPIQVLRYDEKDVFVKDKFEHYVNRDGTDTACVTLDAVKDHISGELQSLPCVLTIKSNLQHIVDK